MNFVDTAVSKIEAGQWRKCCNTLKNIGKENVEREIIMNQFHNQININTGRSKSDSE